MGASKQMNSIHLGNWAELEDLSQVGHNLYDVLEINRLQNSIRDYFNDYLDGDDGVISMNSSNNKNNSIFIKSSFSEKFDIATHKPKYDILKSRKFSKRVQLWVGVVTHCNNEFFEAELKDISCGGTNEIAEFDIDDVSPGDIGLLHVGALFYWSVGHYLENGQSLKKSEIRFQRLITLDEEEISDAYQRTENLFNQLIERKIE